MAGGAKFGERAADRLTDIVGSWPFVIGQAVFLGLWFMLNTVAWCFHWDGYPFILANLFMSAEAAFTGPIIMMSQNRSAEADREILHKDFLSDSRTEQLVTRIAEHLGIEEGSSNG